MRYVRQKPLKEIEMEDKYEPVMQHFSFELYSPTSCTESGVPVVDRVSIQLQGADLPVGDVIAKFELFLAACGYNTKGKVLGFLDE